MGWCSGTNIFDRMAQYILLKDDLKLSDDQKYEMIYAIAEALEDQGWDCQFDSDYIDEPIVRRVFEALGHIYEE